MAGKLPSWNRVKWRGDATLHDGCDDGIDLSKGFFDAGDYLKFTYTVSYAINVLIWGMLEFKQGYQMANEWDRAMNIDAVF